MLPDDDEELSLVSPLLPSLLFCSEESPLNKSTSDALPLITEMPDSLEELPLEEEPPPDGLHRQAPEAHLPEPRHAPRPPRRQARRDPEKVPCLGLREHPRPELQEKVWSYQSHIETHTVETHIYRLRKKILNTFNDKDFIISKKNGYQIK